MSGLEGLLEAASGADWTGEPAEALAFAIEERIVATLPSRLRQALGSDEACQRARVIAWLRCRAIAADRSSAAVEWGYLANHVRWRLADAVRAESLRHNRHVLHAAPPETAAPRSVEPLGPRLERLAHELASKGADLGVITRLLHVAADGPRFERARIAARLVEAGADESLAETLAWLVRGGSAFRSVLARMANGESAEQVFGDPAVQRKLEAARQRFQQASVSSAFASSDPNRQSARALRHVA
jgi:hypothetical protein